MSSYQRDPPLSSPVDGAPHLASPLWRRAGPSLLTPHLPANLAKCAKPGFSGRDE